MYGEQAKPAEAEGVGRWSELKKLAEKATPGPWWVDSHGHRVSTEDGMQTVFITADKMGPATRHPETGNLSYWPNDWDASYIVNASPDKILELIAALSAVTAERDRLREDRDSQQRVCIAEMEKANQLRAEVERLRLDAAAGAVVWKFIDRMGDPAECDPAEDILAEFVAAFDAAMAAKEA